MLITSKPAWFNQDDFPFQPRLIELGRGEALSVTDVGPTAGDGQQTLVFSHGTPVWSYEWRHHLRAFSDRYRCVAPDHLGFGLSPRPKDSDYSPEGHARRFEALMDLLDLKRVTLVVHDYGGPIALPWVIKNRERVERLIIYNTFAGSPLDSPGRERLARFAGGRIFRWLYRNANFSFVVARAAWGDPKTLNKDVWANYRACFPDAASRELVLFPFARALASSASFIERSFSELSQQTPAPMHIIWGMRDRAFPPHLLHRWRESFPSAFVLELENSGHFPHEEEPERCLRALETFLHPANS